MRKINQFLIGILTCLLLILEGTACAQISGDEPVISYFLYYRRDVARVNLSHNGSLYTAETGATVVIEVSLNYAPDMDVTIPDIQTTNTAEGTVSPSSLTFTPENYNQPQEITITGINDDVKDGPQEYYLTFGNIVSSDFFYGGLSVSSLLFSNSDEDSAAINVTPTSGISVAETGTTGNFTVALNSEPVADVQIGLSLDDTTEATLSVSTLSFTTSNWNVAQTVTITGSDDSIQDGSQVYTVLTAPATSSDPVYSNLNASDVSVTTTDNDTAGVTVTSSGCGLFTFEETGPTDTFTVVLDTEPLGTVTIPVASSSTNEGTVSPATLTFTTGDWNVAQTVTVTGVDGFGGAADVGYNVNLGPAVSAGNTDYDAMTITARSAINIHNDTAGVAVHSTCQDLNTLEGSASSGDFYITLRQDPGGSTTLTPVSSDTTEGTGVGTYVFASADWFTRQRFYATGVDDSLDDGNQAFTITFNATGALVGTPIPGSQAMNNVDNDASGVTITENSPPLTTTEAGGTASFTVVLTAEPTANVVIIFTSNDGTEGVVTSGSSAVFTSGDWSVAQTITITGQGDDGDSAGTTPYTISGNIASADGIYAGLTITDINVTNDD